MADLSQFVLIYCLIALLAIAPHAHAADKADLQNAVTIALSGTLSDDHVGPDARRQLEKMIAANAAAANNVALKAIEQANAYGTLQALSVVNVAKLTAESDKKGTLEVLRRYIALADSTISKGPKKAAGMNSDDDATRRIERLRQVRIEAAAFEKTLRD
jgi:hypothetical protein